MTAALLPTRQPAVAYRLLVQGIARYCSLLHGRSIPPIGGHTEFADMRAATMHLPEATKRRIDGWWPSIR